MRQSPNARGGATPRGAVPWMGRGTGERSGATGDTPIRRTVVAWIHASILCVALLVVGLHTGCERGVEPLVRVDPIAFPTSVEPGGAASADESSATDARASTSEAIDEGAQIVASAPNEGSSDEGVGSGRGEGAGPHLDPSSTAGDGAELPPIPDFGDGEQEIRDVAPGVLLVGRTTATPRPLRYWVVRVDPARARPRWVVTEQEVAEARLETTRAFAQRHELTVAMNAHFYEVSDRVASGMIPMGAAGPVEAPWSAARRGWDEVAVLGADGRVTITDGAGLASAAPGGWVIGTSSRILRDGVAGGDRELLHPRSAIGVTEDGAVLLLVADGRQPGVSEGMTTPEVAEVLRAFGAVDALNLDGGGSTTLVVADPELRVVNTPVGYRLPGTERAVLTSFGMAVTPR